MKTPTFILSVILFSAFLNCLGQSYIMPQNSRNEITVSEGIITDNGGAEGQYLNNSSDTLVIFPATPGKYIKLEFSSFDIEECCDTIYIYSGAGSSEGLIEEFNYSPEEVYSTHPSGALTLIFRSNKSGTAAGFQANISLLDAYPSGDVGFTSIDVNPDTVIAGKRITTICNFHNYGSDSLRFLLLECYLSTDTEIDDSDISLASRSLYLLNPFSDGSDYLFAELPLNLPEGKYYIIRRIGDANGNDDGDLSNNTISSPVFVKKAKMDLSIPSITLIPNQISSKISQEIKATVRNNGNVSVREGEAAVYLSDNPVLDANDLKMASVLLPYLSNTDEKEISFRIDPFSDEELSDSIYYLIVKADDSDFIAEVNEENNCFYTQVLLYKETLSGVCNFELKEFNTVVDTVREGKRMLVEMNVFSALEQRAGIWMYLSADEVLDTEADKCIYYNYHNLKPGENLISEMCYFHIEEEKGIHLGVNYLLAEVDAGDEFIEAYEDDNSALTQVWIQEERSFDISITDLTIDRDSVLEEQRFHASYTVSNLGNDYIMPKVAFFLSEDEILDTTDLDLRSNWSSMINAGQSIRETVSLYLQEVEAGDQFIICKTDPDDLIEEWSEENNLLIAPIHINLQEEVEGFDISLLATVVPDTLVIGENQSLSYDHLLHYREDIRISFAAYLSQDQLLDKEDLQFELFIEEREVQAYHQLTRSLEFQVPDPGQEGTYYVILKADFDNLWFEDTESNNTLAKQVHVLAEPILRANLEIKELRLNERISCTSSLVKGRYTLRNLGMMTLDSAILSIDLKRIQTEEIFKDVWSDTLYDISPDPESIDLAFVLPENIPAGIYDLLLSVMPAGDLQDEDPCNNEVSARIGVQKADVDLLIQNAELTPSIVIQNAAIHIDFEVFNAGSTLSATPPVHCYFSTDDMLSDEDFLLGHKIPAGLGINTPLSMDMSFVLPHEVSPGDGYILLEFDPDSTVKELNTDNNHWSAPIEILASDFELYADSINLDVSEGIAYDKVNVSTRIINTGTVDANSLTCRFHLSKDTIPDSNDTQISSTYVSCLAGDTAIASVYFNVPLSLEPGDYYLLCQVDYYNKVVEVREDNNLSWVSFTILVGTDLELSPELLPDTLVVYPITSFAFEVNLKNSGSLTFYDDISFTQYLSVDTILDPTLDIKLAMDMIKTGAYSGMEETVQLEIPIGKDVPYGNYHWFVVLDKEDHVAETNKENNIIRRPVKVLDPEVDLVVTDLELMDGKIELMKEFMVSYTIRNTGPKTVNTSFRNRIYFSADDEISGGDYFFNPLITDVISGESDIEITTRHTLNQSIDPGTYFVIVSLDSHNDITERDENNIFIMTTVEVIANDVNLVFRDGGAHYDSNSDKIVIWGNLENKGDIATWRQFNVGIYQSSDNVLDVSDPMVTYPIVPVIPGNSEEYLNYKIRVPNIPAGDYYYILNADEYGVIKETNENDNTWAYKVNFPNDIPMPDLGIVAAGISQEGENIDLYVEVENIGGRNSTTRTRCKFYYSDDEVFDEEDTYIDDLELSSLDKNERQTLHYVIPIEQLKSNIVAVIDAEHGLNEENEDNNTAFLYLPVDISLVMETAETDFHAGETISVEYILKNETDFISDSIIMGYYFSTDQDLSSGDKLIYSFTAEPVIKGVDVSVRSNINIPEDTQEGKYYLFVQANEKYLEYEQNTENNLGSMVLNVSKQVGFGVAGLSPGIPEIYPIPARSVLYVNSPIRIESYRIVDSGGRYCRSGKVNREQFSLNVDELETGCYYILMKTRSKEYKQMFIIGQR